MHPLESPSCAPYPAVRGCPPVEGYAPNAPDMPPAPGLVRIAMKYLVTIGADTLEVDVERGATAHTWCAKHSARPVEVRTVPDAQAPDCLCLLVDGQTVVAQPADAELGYRQERYTARAQNARDRAAAVAQSGDSAQARRLLASMPGRIVRVLCQPGASVTARLAFDRDRSHEDAKRAVREGRRRGARRACEPRANRRTRRAVARARVSRAHSGLTNTSCSVRRNALNLAIIGCACAASSNKSLASPGSASRS